MRPKYRTRRMHILFLDPEYRLAVCALLARRPDLQGIGVTPYVAQAVKENA